MERIKGVTDIKIFVTPKKEAEELVRKYYSFGLNNAAQSFSWYECKQCALIAVDEIINSRPAITDSQIEYKKYWQEVKKEIEKL
jgi:hypothetical protein